MMNKMFNTFQNGLLTMALILSFALIILTASVMGAYSKPLKYNAQAPIACMPKEVLKRVLMGNRLQPIGVGEAANGFRASVFLDPKSKKYMFVVTHAEKGFGCIIASGDEWQTIKPGTPL